DLFSGLRSLQGCPTDQPLEIDARLCVVPALHCRPRRQELLRRAHHVFLRLLNLRRPGPNSDHPAGGRSRLRIQISRVRGRTGLPPPPPPPPRAPPPISIRSRWPPSTAACALRPAPIPPSRPRPTACCAACRASTLGSPPNGPGSAP